MTASAHALSSMENISAKFCCACITKIIILTQLKACSAVMRLKAKYLNLLTKYLDPYFVFVMDYIYVSNFSWM